MLKKGERRELVFSKFFHKCFVTVFLLSLAPTYQFIQRDAEVIRYGMDKLEQLRSQFQGEDASGTSFAWE